MKLSDTSIRRPVLATVLNLVILLIGIIAYERLTVRLVPNVDVPIVTVATFYPGANAQVIESQITKPIEDALSGIEGVDYISSVSRAAGSGALASSPSSQPGVPLSRSQKSVWPRMRRPFCSAQAMAWSGFVKS